MVFLPSDIKDEILMKEQVVCQLLRSLSGWKPAPLVEEDLYHRGSGNMFLLSPTRAALSNGTDIPSTETTSYRESI